MKHSIHLLVVLAIVNISVAQDVSVETKSVSIDNLIPFIVDTIEDKDDVSEEHLEHYIFLVQTPLGDLIAEDKVILKQAFKLTSSRLSETDEISIITYSGYNGIALRKTPSNNLKAIIHAIEHMKSNVKELHNDGIELAYTYARETSEDNVTSTVVMIRNTKTIISRSATTSTTNAQVVSETSNNGNAVLLTAITLLPQIISVIKD